MIKIVRDDRPGRNCWTVECPICSYEIEFFLATAMYCACCASPIPPFYQLVDEDIDFAQDARLDYHRKGERWIEGDY